MENPAEKFLKAEQAAEELVETLKKLRDEAVTYQNSTSQLDAVREKLILFIEASQNISHDTRAAVELLKSIGGPEIHTSLNKIKGKIGDVDTEVKSTTKSLNENFLKIDTKIDGVSENDRSTSILMEKLCLEINTNIETVVTNVNSSANILTESLTGIDKHVEAVEAEMKLSFEKSNNFLSSELKANIETVVTNVNNSANILSESLTGVDKHVEAVEAEMKSLFEKNNNFLSLELKANMQRMEKLKLLIFVAIGASILAFITSAAILIK